MVTHDHGSAIQTWIALDIAKDYNAVLIELPGGKRSSFRMANHRQDHDRLVDYVRSLPQPCRFGFEATGNYHRPLAYRLLRENFEVRLISSVASSRYREVLHNSWDKNDPKDAAVLLSMLKQGITQQFVDPLVQGFHDLQELSKTYANVTLARTRLQHSLLTHYLPLYFPEMRRFWHSSRSEWFIRYLLVFTTPGHVTALNFEQFREQAWSLIGKKPAKEEKLNEFYVLAQASIALEVDPDSLAVQTFRLQLERYQRLNEDRARLQQLAQQALEEHPDYRILLTIPGIGPINALTILAEGGDLRRFKHHRQFLKYCGFDLAKSQSGQSRGQEVLSKRGNARLRLAFWMAAQVAVTRPENSVRDKFARYIKANPTDRDLRRKAMTAAAAKLARIAYGLIKRQQPYQGHYEHALPSGSIPLCRAVEAKPTS